MTKLPSGPTVADHPSGIQMVQSGSAITHGPFAGCRSTGGSSSARTIGGVRADARRATTSTGAPGRK